VGEVEEIIRREIARNGSVSVARFIGLALYHPDCGYYRRNRSPFGKAGDFYTAEQLQPVFGELIASYVALLAASANSKGRFSILELGSGHGNMRAALGQWNYRGFDWIGDALPVEMQGLVLANEFFDALPVHLLEKHEAKWMELGVILVNNRLTLAVIGPPSDMLEDYARRFGSLIPDGGLLEMSLDAAVWLHRVSHIHKDGTFLIIDYGYSECELARFERGTLMTYRQHQATSDFLVGPGERDITAHVNFSYLKELAIRYGYLVGFDGPFSAWIKSVWDEDELSRRWNENDERWRLQWKQLFFGLGGTFRVLELRKHPW
jgi:SAM-dependent MidA family methyltransferase